MHAPFFFFLWNTWKQNSFITAVHTLPLDAAVVVQVFMLFAPPLSIFVSVRVCKQRVEQHRGREEKIRKFTFLTQFATFNHCILKDEKISLIFIFIFLYISKNTSYGLPGQIGLITRKRAK